MEKWVIRAEMVTGGVYYTSYYLATRYGAMLSTSSEIEALLAIDNYRASIMLPLCEKQLEAGYDSSIFYGYVPSCMVRRLTPVEVS